MKHTALKRIAALLLTLVMVCALIPFEALAWSIYGTNYSGYTTKVGNVTLPLPEYPNGSACTNNGYPCSGPGHFGSNCKRYYYYNGQTVDVYGWQCCGFARYVFWRCFGVVPTDGNGSGYYKAVSNVGGGSISVGYLQSIFGSKVKAGAHIRTGLGKDGFNHSLIYAGCDSNYVYTYEGNFDGYCRVSMVRRSWSEMVSYLQYKNGIYYIDMPNNYPASVNSKYIDPTVFNAGYYRDHNSDLASMNDSQLQDHWVNYGIKEGRCASAAFDVRWYLASNTDLRNAFGDNFAGALEHFVDHGIQEGRAGSPSFNLTNYKNTYEDLRNAFGDNNHAYYEHYAQHGYYESRNAGLVNGTYTIGLHEDNSFKIGIEGDSTDTGAQAKAKQQTYADNQKFAFEHDGANAYTIRNLTTNKYLEILYGGANGEYKVTQCHYTGADCQKWYAIAQGDGSYALLNKGTGKYMDLASGTVADGNDIQTWEGNGSAAQKWWLTPTSAMRSGVYKLGAANDSNMLLNVAGNSHDNGANVWLWEAANNAGDQWVVSFNEDGYYTLRETGSNKYLDVANGDWYCGTNVQLYQGNGSDCQKWTVIRNTDNTYSFYSKRSGLALDLDNGETTNGKNVHTWSANYSAAQKWVPQLQSVLADGTYVIGNVADQNYRLEIYGRSTENGGNLILFPAHDATSQRFTFTKQSDGLYTITNVNSGKNLDVAGGGKAPGTNIQQWEGNGDNQRWSVLPNEDGSYSFVGSNNLFMDLCGNNLANDTNIMCWNGNGCSAQRWVLRLDDSQAPVISDVKVTEVSADGYRVTCNVSDNIGVTSVKFPTWTEADGQDDIIWHEASVSNGVATYYIAASDHNTEYGRYITHIYAYDAFGNSTSTGTGATVPAKDNKATMFGDLPSGIYTIGNAANKNFVLDVNGCSMDNGANVHVWTFYNLQNQMWVITNQGNGYYTIRNLKSGKNLDADNYGTTDGTNILQYDAHNGDNQLWQVVVNSNGTYTFINKHSGLALDMSGGGKPSDGVNVQTWTRNNTSAQQWYLTPQQVVANGTYSIHSKANTSYALDVDADNINDYGSNLQVWGYSVGSNNQKFNIEYIGKGMYTIRCVASGRYLNVAGGGKTSGTNVHQWNKDTPNADEKWQLIVNADGSYSFIADCNGLYMDLYGGVASNGANICTYQGNGSNAQKWELRNA